MSRITGSKPSFLGGLYQVPDREIPDNGASGVMDNTIISRQRGVHKRPPTWHKGIIDPDTSSPADPLFVHHVKRSDTDRYSVVCMSGEILVYDSITGVQKAVSIPQPVLAAEYLTSTLGFRAVTIGDSTVLVNKDTVVAKKENRAAAKRYEATVQVREANYSNTYSIKLGNIEVKYSTQALGSLVADKTLATEVVARGLWRALKTHKFLKDRYAYLYYGNVIHISRLDAEDFVITTGDSLGDKGLQLVKDTVQVFEDLPPVSKEGMLVRILGDLTTGKDDYWVQFQKIKGFEQMGGTWEEVPAPGASTGMNPATMPWALTRYGSHVGKRTVLKDPFAPTIRSFQYRDLVGWETSYGHDFWTPGTNAGGWNTDDPAAEFVLTEDNAVTPDHYMAGLGVDSSSYWMGMVHFDVDASELEPTQKAGVALQRYDGSVWVTQDSRDIEAGEIVKNAYLRTPVANDDSSLFPWRIKLTYWRPGSTSTTTKARVTLHGSTHPTHPGVWAVADPNYKIIYDPTAQYPEGHAEYLRFYTFVPEVIPGATNYSLAAQVTVPPGGYTGSQMRAAMVAAINLAALSATPPGDEFLAVDDGDEVGISLYYGPGYEPYFGSLNGGAENAAGELFLVERVFSYIVGESLRVDGEVIPDAELNGMILNNLTDGSSATVVYNVGNSIVTGPVTGGARNTYEAGDIIEVIGETGDFFVFDMINWTDRLAGDDVSCPLPSFVGKRINEVFFHENRLAFTSGENVVLSAAGDLFRFTRRTASDLLPTDPVDVRHSYPATAVFDSATEYEGSIFLFSEAGHQFRLSGDPVITPSTVRCDHVGSHPCSATKFRPVAIGSKLYFARKVKDYSRIMEAWLSQDADGNLVMNARDITGHVPRYLKGNVVSLAGDSSAGMLGVLTDGDSRGNTYMWSFEEGEDGKPLNAWCRWTFSDPVWAMDMHEGQMWIAVVRQPHPTYGYGGVCLEALDMVTPTRVGDTLHWDRQGIANIAKAYLMQIGIPNLWARRSDGARDFSANLIIQYLSIGYTDAGLLVTKVRTRHRPTATEYVVFSGSGSSGNQRVPLMCRNDAWTGALGDIVLQCEHFYGIGISGIEWEGYYEKRGK